MGGTPELEQELEQSNRHAVEAHARIARQRELVGPPDVLDIEPDCGLNAIGVTVLSPAAKGFRIWLDMPLALDVALRLIGSYARLRKIAS
jgi:hypothetical protein